MNVPINCVIPIFFLTVHGFMLSFGFPVFGRQGYRCIVHEDYIHMLSSPYILFFISKYFELRFIYGTTHFLFWSFPYSEARRRKWLEANPESSNNDSPVIFDTSIVPWWAWIKRFHLPEAELLNGQFIFKEFFSSMRVEKINCAYFSS